MRAAIGKFCLVSICCMSPSFGETSKDPDAEEKSEQDQINEVSIVVPKALVNQGYRLVFDGSEVDLGQSKVVIQPTLDPVPIELYDKFGNLVDDRSDFVDADVFHATRARRFALAIQLGSAHSADRSSWKKVFLSGDRFQFGLEFDWWFQRFGLKVGAGIQGEGATKKEGFRSVYSGVYYQLLAAYRMALMPRSQAYWRKLGVIFLLGPGYYRDRVVIEDETTRKEGSGSGVGATAGLAVKWPMANNFHLDTRYLSTYRTIDIPEFDLEVKGLHHQLFFGFGYAF